MICGWESRTSCIASHRLLSFANQLLATINLSLSLYLYPYIFDVRAERARRKKANQHTNAIKVIFSNFVLFLFNAFVFGVVFPYSVFGKIFRFMWIFCCFQESTLNRLSTIFSVLFYFVFSFFLACFVLFLNFSWIFLFNWVLE